MITIPLTNGAANAHQILFIQLELNFVEFRVNWNTTQSQWYADLYLEGVLQAAGVMLLPGSELLSDYEADIGRLVINGTEPTLDNLGISNELVWISDNE